MKACCYYSLAFVAFGVSRIILKSDPAHAGCYTI